MALGGFADASKEVILADPEDYLRKITDTSERAVQMPDGSKFAISDHELFWITDGSRFIGTVSFRYAGDKELIELIGGHVGMAIRPSLLNRGYGVKAAEAAWHIVRQKMQERGIRSLIATCSPSNRSSKRLIEHNGGQLIDQSENIHGFGPNLTFQINLEQTAST
jgi:predicted acetyltransferase